jgi:hypothetical protein
MAAFIRSRTFSTLWYSNLNYPNIAVELAVYVYVLSEHQFCQTVSVLCCVHLASDSLNAFRAWCLAAVVPFPFPSWLDVLYTAFCSLALRFHVTVLLFCILMIMYQLCILLNINFMVCWVQWARRACAEEFVTSTMPSSSSSGGNYKFDLEA